MAEQFVDLFCCGRGKRMRHIGLPMRLSGLHCAAAPGFHVALQQEIALLEAGDAGSLRWGRLRSRSFG